MGPTAKGPDLEEDRRSIQEALRVSGKGSVLRGWRRELDSDGSLDCTFLQFCRATRRLDLPVVDVPRLFGEDSPDSLTLEEVAPELGRLARSFREWTAAKFGGPAGLLEVFEAHKGEGFDGTLGRSDFVAGCKQHGFSVHGNRCRGAHLEELFCMLDLEETGVLTFEDVMFLDLDSKKRGEAMTRRKHLVEVSYLKQITAVAREEMSSKLPPLHRRAPREWHKALYEQLPEVAQEKQRRRRDTLHRRSLEARSIFMDNIVKTFGDPIRAWRMALDVGCRYKVTKTSVAKYCQQRRLPLCMSDLWRALDLNGDGLLQLQEMGPAQASALASLKNWAGEHLGSTASIWGHAEAERAREALRSKSTWKSDKNMPMKAFMQVLRALRWPWLDQQHEFDPLLVLKGLDYHGCGFVSVEDLAWLDKWDAPAWLSAKPDAQAWAQLKAALLRVYKDPLRTWRGSLDSDDTNTSTFREFAKACKKVGFTGNIDGAWRHLDDNCSGVITLEEFDPPTAMLLRSFKQWVESIYGGLETAFRYMDNDGSGCVSFSELKKECTKRGWVGDVAALFECIRSDKSPGKRTLSYKDLLFLETWSPEEELDIGHPSERVSRMGSRQVSRRGSGTNLGEKSGTGSEGAGSEGTGSVPFGVEKIQKKGMSKVKSAPVVGMGSNVLKLPPVASAAALR